MTDPERAVLQADVFQIVSGLETGDVEEIVEGVKAIIAHFELDDLEVQRRVADG